MQLGGVPEVRHCGMIACRLPVHPNNCPRSWKIRCLGTVLFSKCHNRLYPSQNECLWPYTRKYTSGCAQSAVESSCSSIFSCWIFTLPACHYGLKSIGACASAGETRAFNAGYSNSSRDSRLWPSFGVSTVLLQAHEPDAGGSAPVARL